MNEENPVAGLGPPEAMTVSVVSPCRSVAPILLPFGTELGVFDPVTKCAFFCHPAMNPLVFVSLGTIQTFVAAQPL